MGASEMETKETLNREIRVQCVVLMHGRVLKSSGNANVWLCRETPHFNALAATQLENFSGALSLSETQNRTKF